MVFFFFSLIFILSHFLYSFFTSDRLSGNLLKHGIDVSGAERKFQPKPWSELSTFKNQQTAAAETKQQ
jgi:hypothetical protein